MARRYQLKRRAERQAETHHRIVEAALELHAELGPARTSLSAIAVRAGVQRHTLYAHFPTERDIFVACTGLYMGRNPPPDPRTWGEIAEPWARLRLALEELYAWFTRNEAMLGHVFRDAEVHPLTGEMLTLQMGPWREAAAVALGEGLAPSVRRRAAIDLALGFATWRSLVRESGLAAGDAVALMVELVRCGAAEVPTELRR